MEKYILFPLTCDHFSHTVMTWLVLQHMNFHLSEDYGHGHRIYIYFPIVLCVDGTMEVVTWTNLSYVLQLATIQDVQS